MSDYRLTPEGVRAKQFSTTRLQPGYHETDVDEFLDLVESEIALLIREREDARAALEELRRILPKDQTLDELTSKVAALYRVIWGKPHPGADTTK